MADTSRPLDGRDRAAFAAARALAPGMPAVLTLNKADLPHALREDDAPPLFGDMPPAAVVACSAATGAGLARGLTPWRTPSPPCRALEEAIEALAAARAGLAMDAPLDLVCSDLRAAVSALGAITGQDVGEDLLTRIFGDFCIGK